MIQSDRHHHYKWLGNDSARHWSQDNYTPISQIVLKNFIKISLIIKECTEEIWLKQAIVLKILKSSWNTDWGLRLVIIYNEHIADFTTTAKVLMKYLLHNKTSPWLHEWWWNIYHTKRNHHDYTSWLIIYCTERNYDRWDIYCTERNNHDYWNIYCTEEENMTAGIFIAQKEITMTNPISITRKEITMTIGILIAY